MAVAKRRFDLAKSNADFATTAGSVGHTGQRPAEGTAAEESLSGRYVGGDIFRAETEDRIKSLIESIHGSLWLLMMYGSG